MIKRPAEPKLTEAQMKKVQEYLDYQKEKETFEREFTKLVQENRQLAAQALGMAEQEKNHDQTFFAEVEARKDAVKKRLGIRAKVKNGGEEWLEEAAKTYGCSVDDLKNYVMSERQVRYYQSNHPRRIEAENATV